MLKEALSSNSQQQMDPDFGHTRETILQVYTILIQLGALPQAFITSIKPQRPLSVKESDSLEDNMGSQDSIQADWDVDRMTTLLSEVENFPGTTVQSDTLKWRYSGMGFSL
ncbi:hypothetical protein MTR67_004362 [Solanum verrucosum]|uniref:Uncharacterized protein n=1 Tax=Solanum verrucosum TaxID=315347 RepID=A0AAF0PU94_SOLVR|nr:hypothetical protein MTR67_004362 [Solanum verrucosum]